MISIGEFRNAADVLDTETVTVKYIPLNTSGKLPIPGFSGYSLSPSRGSTVNGLCAFKSDATINGMFVSIFGGSTNLTFSLSGIHTNAGWTTMNIDGTNYSRSSATFSQDTSTSPGVTKWVWNPITSIPFGTTDGATKVVTWV
jgi:hypothetical protein